MVSEIILKDTKGNIIDRNGYDTDFGDIFYKDKSQYKAISIFLNKEDAAEHCDFIRSNYGETAIIKEVEINIK